MDIHAEWEGLMGANAGEIIAFTCAMTRATWRMKTDDEEGSIPFPVRLKKLEDYRRDAMSSDYKHCISASLEFILQETDIQLNNSYLLR